MRIIDRYVLRQFLWSFLVCYLSLTGLYVVFDAFTHMEAFLDCAEKQGNLLGLVGSYYAYRSVLFFDRTSGLLTLIAAMFTVTWIQRHNEMTALMSAGISRIRAVTPLIAAAVGITLLAAANRELVLPRFREHLARKPQDLLGRRGQELTPQYDHQTGILLRGQRTYREGQRISKPNFLLPPGLRDYGKLLVAEEAFYRPPQEGRPGGYLLDGLKEPKGLDTRPSLRLGGRPVVIAPRDVPGWLRPKQCFVVSQVSFEQLAAGDTWRQYSSTAELIAGLRNRSLDFGANVRVAIHSRFVQPFLDVTLLFLGLPLVIRRHDRNVFSAIGLCALVVAGFTLLVVGFQHLGSLYWVPPALASWAPLMIFVPLAVGMAESMWR